MMEERTPKNTAKILNMPTLPYAIEEAVNRLRVNISFLGSEVKKIMVISSMPDEGKSFVTMQLWRQMAADVLGITLKTAESSDSSLGSAMLAGIAAGVFKNPSDAVAKCVKPKSVTVPNPENTEKYREIFGEYKKIHDALAPIYSER